MYIFHITVISSVSYHIKPRQFVECQYLYIEFRGLCVVSPNAFVVTFPFFNIFLNTLNKSMSALCQNSNMAAVSSHFEPKKIGTYYLHFKFMIITKKVSETD